MTTPSNVLEHGAAGTPVSPAAKLPTIVKLLVVAVLVLAAAVLYLFATRPMDLVIETDASLGRCCTIIRTGEEGARGSDGACAPADQCTLFLK